MNPVFNLEDIQRISQDNTEDTASQGRSFMAVAAAMLWPGAGHILAGKRRAGWIIACLWLAIILVGVASLLDLPLLPIFFVLVPLGVLLQLLQLFHAAHCGRHSDRSMLGSSSMRFQAGAIMAMSAVGMYCAVINVVLGNWIELGYSPTPSMSPNISPDDVFMNLTWQPCQRWDIVGVNLPKGIDPETTRLVKRLVGLPGDTIEITGDGLKINGKVATPPAGAGPYFAVDMSNNPLSDAEPMAAANGCWGRPITLGPDEYFVLGDNSSGSYDSRFWPSIDDHQPGAVPRDDLHGRVSAILWPPQRWRVFELPADGKQ